MLLAALMSRARGQDRVAGEFAAVIADHLFDFPSSIAGRSSSCSHPLPESEGGRLSLVDGAQSSVIAEGGILRNGAKIAGFLRDLILRCELAAKRTAIRTRKCLTRDC